MCWVEGAGLIRTEMKFADNIRPSSDKCNRNRLNICSVRGWKTDGQNFRRNTVMLCIFSKAPFILCKFSGYCRLCSTCLNMQVPSFGPHIVFGRSDSSSDYFPGIINRVFHITQTVMFGVKDELHFCIKHITWMQFMFRWAKKWNGTWNRLTRFMVIVYFLRQM